MLQIEEHLNIYSSKLIGAWQVKRITLALTVLTHLVLIGRQLLTGGPWPRE